MDVINFKKQDRSAIQSELEQAGARFKGNSFTCPYHDDKHPSAGIFQNEAGEWYFKCQTCRASGDVWDVISKSTGKGIDELFKSIRNESGVNCRRPSGTAVNNVKIYADIEQLKAGCPGKIEEVYKYTNPKTKKPDMIVIRCMTNDGKTFRQARPCPGGFEMKAPPKPWPIYNRTRVQQADTVVVVEGEKCAHTLQNFGIVATTSPAGAGKASYADWSMLAGKNIVLWPDNDDTGIKHMKQVENILQALEPAPRVSIINPIEFGLDNKEDVADFIVLAESAGLDVHSELQNAIQLAKPKGVSSGVSDRIEAMIDGKFISIEMPWNGIKKLTNALMPGTVTLLCGSPGASKSFMLLEALAYWVDNGIKSCIYELEEDREFHLMRALAQKTGIPALTNPDWVKANPEEARDAYKTSIDTLELLGRSIWEAPETQPTLEQVGQWARDRAKQGYRVICIDPITAVAQTGKPWIEDASFIQKIKQIVTEYQCSIVLSIHPTKAVSLPDMSQLSGGAAFSRFTQTILWLEYHEDKTSSVKTCCGVDDITHNRTLHILKARNGKGNGLPLAFNFSPDSLTLNEYGIIIKKKKK